MNIHVEGMGITAPPVPRSLVEVGINLVTMRDILLKTMFRKGADREFLDDLAIKLSSLAPRNQPWR